MAGRVEAQPNPKSRLRRWPWLGLDGWRALRSNPIMVKELRYRMRSWHGMVDLGTYTILLSLFGLLSYTSAYTSSISYRYYGNSYYYTNLYTIRSQELGTNYFTSVVVALLFLASILAPSFTAPTIAGEKERQTYDVLLVTLLRPRDIIVGKMFAALAYFFLVTIVSIPVASVAFLMGGVSLDQFVAALIITILSGLMFGAIGIYWSCVMRTSREAGRNAFLNVLVLLFVLPIGIVFGLTVLVRPYFSINGNIFYSDSLLKEALGWVLSINPMYAVMGTNEILQNRPDSNLFFYSYLSYSFILTPFVRFVIIGSFITYFYTWRAGKRIKPTRSDLDRGPLKIGKNKGKKAEF